MSKIYMIMGETCSGKNYIYNLIMNYFSSTKFVNNIMPLLKYTDRPERADITKNRYNFVDTEFIECMDESRVISTIEYKTSESIYKIVSYDYLDISMDYIVIGSPKEYSDYIEYFKDSMQIVPILVEADLSVRSKRFLNRDLSIAHHKVIKKREYKLSSDSKEFSESNLSNYGLKQESFYRIKNNSDGISTNLFIQLVDLIRLMNTRSSFWIKD